jgi:hypothetical protein
MVARAMEIQKSSGGMMEEYLTITELASGRDRA